MEMVGFCPLCEDEFRPDIKICSDCGEALVLQAEGLGAKGLASRLAPTNGEHSNRSEDWRTELDSLPVSSLVPLRTFDSLEDLEPGVAALAEIELPSRVLVQNGRYILLVRPDTLGPAQDALHSAHESNEADADADHGFDASAGRYAICPACGTGLPAEIKSSCPECGLELSAPPASVTVPDAD
jgi:hypothetical protein